MCSSAHAAGVDNAIARLHQRQHRFGELARALEVAVDGDLRFISAECIALVSNACKQHNRLKSQTIPAQASASARWIKLRSQRERAMLHEAGDEPVMERVFNGLAAAQAALLTKLRVNPQKRYCMHCAAEVVSLRPA